MIMTNIKKIALALVITLAVGYGVYASQQKSELSELALANVEALANGETGTSNTGPREREKCYGGGHKMVCRGINSNPCEDSDCF
jgi:hypothetical protein